MKKKFLLFTILITLLILGCGTNANSNPDILAPTTVPTKSHNQTSQPTETARVVIATEIPEVASTLSDYEKSDYEASGIDFWGGDVDIYAKISESSDCDFLEKEYEDYGLIQDKDREIFGYMQATLFRLNSLNWCE